MLGGGGYGGGVKGVVGSRGGMGWGSRGWYGQGVVGVGVQEWWGSMGSGWVSGVQGWWGQGAVGV